MPAYAAELAARVSVEGVDKAERDFRSFGGAIHTTADRAKQAGGIMAGAFSVFTGNILTKGFDLAAGALRGVGSSVIDTNAELQEGATAWEVLLGSADAAEQKLSELTRFAATTPFEFAGVSDAARLLETFGGEALNTTKTLTMVGDIASGVGQPFEDVAMWTGRMFDALQSGKPFGEAAARLQEMGAMSGETRSQLEEMQKQGKSGDEIFAAFTGSMDRFGGMMEKQSQNWSGLKSTFSDTINLMAAEAGKPIFEKLSGGLSAVNTMLASEEMQAAVRTFADGLAGGIETAVSAFSRLSGIVSDVWGDIVDGFNEGGIAGAIQNGLGRLGDMISAWVASSGPGILEQFKTWGAGLGNWVIEALPGVLDNLATMRERLLGWVSEALPAWLQALGGFAAPAVQWILDAIPGLLENLGTFAQRMIDQTLTYLPQWAGTLVEFGVKAVSWIADKLPALAANLGQFYNRMVNWVVDSLPKWGAQLAQLGSKVAGWVLDALPGLAANLGKMTGQLLGWIVQTAVDVVPKLVVLAGKFLGWVATDVLPKLPGVLAAIAGALWTFITTVAAEAGPKIAPLARKFYTWVTTDVLPELPGKLAAILGSIGTWITTSALPWAGRELAKIGAAIVGGIQSGITSAWGRFETWIGQQIAKIPEPIRLALGMQSPSRLMAQLVGEPLVAGIEQGVAQGLPQLLSRMRKVGDEATRELRGSLEGGSGMVRLHGVGAEVTGSVGGVRSVGSPLALSTQTPVLPSMSSVGGGTTIILQSGAIVVNGIRDAREAALEIRRELIALDRRNGYHTGGLFG